MSRFKNKVNGKVVNAVDLSAAGMCSYTLGITFVLYTDESLSLPHHLVMEHKEFHNRFNPLE